MRRIACLHTAASNIALFDAACPPGLTLHHAVRVDLLAEAEQAGGLTGPIAQRTREALAALSGDAVLLTCSTLGPAAAPPVLRADAALAEAACHGGGTVVALIAVQTTRAPTEALFAAAAARHGATCTVRLVPDAWAAFRAGDTARYHGLVAAAADAAFAEGARQVALAQASMAPAAGLCLRGRPLTAPAAALQALA